MREHFDRALSAVLGKKRGDNVEKTKQLLEAGHDVHEVDELGTTALIWAARGNNVEVCVRVCCSS